MWVHSARDFDKKMHLREDRQKKNLLISNAIRNLCVFVCACCLTSCIAV